MLLDARVLADGHVERASVCIIGSGPAGIALARELVKGDRRVCLVESGGLLPDEATQDLCGGETAGDSDQSLAATRVRRFGGTSNAWEIDVGDGVKGVRLTPLTDVDFEARGWIPNSGWPIARSDLDAHYSRAREVCGLEPSFVEGPAAPDGASGAMTFPSGRVESTEFEIGRADIFSHDYRDELTGNRRVRVLLNATVLGLECDDLGRSVVRARVGCLTGTGFVVEAQIFVVAAGAIENARLLLLSTRDHPKGLGNQHDLVGRFFMDHSLDFLDRFKPSTADRFGESEFYDVHRAGSQWAMGRLTPSPETVRREPVLNVAVHLLPRHRTHQPLAIQMLRAATRRRLDGVPRHDGSLRTREVIEETGLVAERALHRLRHREEHVPMLATGLWSARVANPERQFGYFELVSQIEQLPDPSNRVTLTATQDRFGQRRARVEWRSNRLELEGLRRTRELIRHEVRQAGLGTVWMKRGRASYTGCHHHLGTTRMHDNPRGGVVDANCRVHGVTNLYVAGSSVFPTGGYANPTLTIVALAIRLADHLTGHSGRSPSP